MIASGYMVSAATVRTRVLATTASDVMKQRVLIAAAELTDVNDEIDCLSLGFALGQLSKSIGNEPDLLVAIEPLRDQNQLPFVRTPRGVIS